MGLQQVHGRHEKVIGAMIFACWLDHCSLTQEPMRELNRKSAASESTT